jgi:hypothetical protein
VVYTNKDLVNCFEPKASFLGLDALHLSAELPAGEVHGQKYHDLNADGEAGANEPGLAGWEIHLDGTDIAGTTVHRETKTNASGVYSFTVLLGTYTVAEVCPADAMWYQSAPPPQDQVCGSGVHVLTLEIGDSTKVGIDFGNYLPEQRQETYLPVVLKGYE